MLALLYLLLLGMLAGQVQSRVALLASFQGLPRYLGALGLTLFLANWINFLLYALLGPGGLYLRCSWGVLLLLLFYWSKLWLPHAAGPSPWVIPAALRRLLAVRTWNYWFLFLAAFVLVRFYAGIDADEEGNIWSTFNFVDTPFHLSVANAFLGGTGFPPMDLDMAPYPLKYHFLADFHVAHLARLGLPALRALWLMNLVSATVMVGVLWGGFERWLQLPPRWLMLAGFVFLFLNTALLNVLHYVVLQPRFFNPDNLFHGLLRFPYFNFESAQSNLLEPQRGLLFSLPILLLILHAACGEKEDPAVPADAAASRTRTLEAFLLTCLLPLAHIVGFAVLSCSLVARLWQHRVWFLSRGWIWAPVFALGILQLLYLGYYGPPTHAQFSSWSLTSFPVQDFQTLPPYARRLAFWFFANGDYFFWGGVFAALAWARRADLQPASNSSLGLWQFLRQWRWYFAVCGGFFALINVYRYSPDWGDSNKFVLFFNLGLTLVIVQGAAQWIGRRGQFLSHALWIFFLALCIAPPAYAFYLRVIIAPHGAILLFEKNGRKAAEWTKQHLPPREVILTAAYNTMHWVTPLAGRPTLAGIYGDSNPYRQDERAEAIRRIYENGDLPLIQQLGVRYVCLSRNERRKYQIHPRWTQLMASGQGVVFQAGEGPGDAHAVFLFDASRFSPP